jgi:hypothetical protein
MVTTTAQYTGWQGFSASVSVSHEEKNYFQIHGLFEFRNQIPFQNLAAAHISKKSSSS